MIYVPAPFAAAAIHEAIDAEVGSSCCLRKNLFVLSDGSRLVRQTNVQIFYLVVLEG